ncbi:MAG TPA: sugar ABC transporter substrate-binding protein [Clostridiaceae bacterium]|nr:sugar ABC transporter substrate-binding protein [Clostridiaceae bacterium]
MKKVLAVLLVVVLLFVFAACSSTSTTPSQGSESQQTDGDKVKHIIGMIWYGNTDPMGGTFYAWANHAAEIADVELVWHFGDFTTEAQLAACEQMISAGCEGIYFIPMDTAANLQLGNACKNAGVYWAISNRDILDQDIKAACYANPYMVTHIWDDSYDLAKGMVKILADQGITKVCMISGDPKDAMMVDRNNGYRDGCEDHGIEILGTFQSEIDAKVISDGVSNFLTLYPDMQAILAVNGTGGVGEAIISTLEGSGKDVGSVKVATFDTFAGNKEAFEKGWLSANCGGYTSECLVAFLALVNRVKGNIKTDGPFKLHLSPIIITSSEEMDIFAKYVDNPDVQLYSDEDIRGMLQPTCDEAYYQNILDNWTMDFVRQAVGE